MATEACTGVVTVLVAEDPSPLCIGATTNPRTCARRGPASSTERR